VVVLIPGDGISISGESKLKKKNSEERDNPKRDLNTAAWLSGWGQILSENSRHIVAGKENLAGGLCEC
jgi:hypothetical protein